MDADLLGREIQWIEFLGKGLAPACEKQNPKLRGEYLTAHREVKLAGTGIEGRASARPPAKEKDRSSGGL
jgi:hypothetical protein